jgi:hypothetical protein
LSTLGFAEWWIGEGGKFHVIGMEPESLQLELLNHPAPDFQGNVHCYGYQSTHPYPNPFNMPQDLDTGILNDPARAPVQATHQETYVPKPPAAPRKSTHGDTPTPKHARCAKRTFPPGAYRIWKEMSVQVPQSIAKTHSAKHLIFGRAAFYTIDLRLLSDVYLTALELVTWFPEHMIYWPDFVYRLGGAGWSPSDMIKYSYIVHGMNATSSVDIQQMAERDRSRLSHYRTCLGLARKDAPILHPYADFTCTNWQLPQIDKRITPGHIQNTFIDYYLSDVSEGIPLDMFPTGHNAGPLTAALELVRNHPDDPVYQSLKLSGVSQFVKNTSLFRTAEEAGLQTSPPLGVPHADYTASRLASAFVHLPQYHVSIVESYRRNTRT